VALIRKSELNYTYNWRPVPENDPRISGEPDLTLLNRNQGPEVLYIINWFAARNNLKDLSDALKLEKIIKEYLPGIFRTQLHTIQWLQNNWKNLIWFYN
jgi:hypothetical protein